MQPALIKPMVIELMSQRIVRKRPAIYNRKLSHSTFATKQNPYSRKAVGGGIGPKSNTQLSNLPAHFPWGCQRLTIRQLARSNEANNHHRGFRAASYNSYENHIPHRFRSQPTP